MVGERQRVASTQRARDACTQSERAAGHRWCLAENESSRPHWTHDDSVVSALPLALRFLDFRVYTRRSTNDNAVNEQKHADAQEQVDGARRFERERADRPYDEHHERGENTDIHELTGLWSASSLGEPNARGEETTFLSQQVHRVGPISMLTPRPSAGKAGGVVRTLCIRLGFKKPSSFHL